MKIFKKVLKNKLFYLVLLLGVFLSPILKFTLHAQEVYDNGFNLANPDIANKEYLGDGVYRVSNLNGITIDYNVFNGEYELNGTTINTGFISDDIFKSTLLSGELTVKVIYISGEKSINDNDITIRLQNQPNISPTFANLIKSITNNYDNQDRARIWVAEISTFTNYKFKLQVEKGDTATPYKLPIQALYDHAYNDGYGDGYEDGYRNGEFDGYQYGYEAGEIDGYEAGEIDGYEAGEIDGYESGKIDGYDEGYQDGVSDTHDYYDDNGLFIPKLTPKAHLVIDYDLRYGEPYFYLQDFSGEYDPDYFGFQHNKWLEKAFDWAYSTENDFLAINDLYTLKYQSDEVIYKYFFYKYDTDSIYFYNNDGTLLKIVERALFDYYVYEVPELSQEEQARIDNAYNKGMRDYGYYDSESEEYLTATEYGEIRYNQGVISTRDKAYSDGFVVAMWYSHQHGFDWVRATYYDLIAERPILHNTSDLTSFSYQAGYDEGFDDGDYVGYDRGYDWGYDDGLDDGYEDGLDDGYEDGYEKGYYKGYQVAVDNTYDTIYDDVYKIGYKDGQKTGMNNKFYTGLEKWIVPAIIVVLFFGLLMLFPKNKEN